MAKTLATDVDYLTSGGALLLAEKIRDFWKRRNVLVNVSINRLVRGQDGTKDIYTLSSDIAWRPEFRAAHIDMPVKYMGQFHTVSA